MRTEEIFRILEIEPVKDETAIKNAYRRKLVSVNPEDDQEGFKRLRKAYEEACVYAKDSEEKRAEDEDITPSGLWVRQAADLYGRFSMRCDKEAWKRLFQEDAFLSLEENEECRRKLLVFFMGHFNFPYEIWQLFDKYLCIQEDKDRLKEVFPSDYVQFLVQKCEEKEVMDFSLFQGPDEGGYDLFMECYREGVNALNRQDWDSAEKAVEKADSTRIFHPYMEIVRALAYKGIGKEKEAEKLFMQLREKYPDNAVILFHVSNFFWDRGRKEEAWDGYGKLRELDRNNYMANYRLAFYYYEKGDYLSAQNCIQLISGARLNGELLNLLKDIHGHLEPELQRRWKENKDFAAVIELAGNYYQEERYYSACREMEAAADSVPEEKKEEYLQLLARVYIGLAENEKALEIIRRWQAAMDERGEENQDSALRLKISAYHMMGRGFARYFTQAEEEYEKIKEKPGKGPELLMEMAQIFLEKKEYQKCLELSEALLDKHRIYFAYVFMLKAYAGLWDGAGVIRCGRKCTEYFPAYAYPYEEMAKVYYDTGHMDELKEILELAKKNKVESCYLDACVYHGETVPEDFPIRQKMDEFENDYQAKVAWEGKPEFYQKGYPLITQYLRMCPCNFLLSRRGRFSMSAKDYKAAMKDFQKVLERDLADAAAYNSIGCLYKYYGEYEKAIVFFNKAIYYMNREGKEEPTSTYFANLAQMYERLGDYRRAAEIYRYIYDEFRPSEAAIRGMTVNYARVGKIKEAKSIIENTCANDVAYMEQRIYKIYLYAGEFSKAFRRIRRWKVFSLCGICPAMSANNRSRYRYITAWELLLRGRQEKSLKAVEQALETFAENDGRKKDRIDMVLDKIFILTMRDIEDVSGREENRNHLSEEDRENAGDCPELADIRKKAANCLEQLESILYWVCEGWKKDGKDINLTETREFFYKDRYVKYVDFVIALFGQGVQAGEKAWKKMGESLRCSNCSHAACMRLKLAEAMLLEQQGKGQQALEVYKKLEEEQPYNLYARAKLNFCTAKNKNGNK